MLEVGSTSNIVVSSRFWLKCIATLRNSSNFALASIGVNKVSIWTHRKIVNAMYQCAEMVWAIYLHFKFLKLWLRDFLLKN